HDPNYFAFHAKQVKVAIGWRSLWERKLVVSRTMMDQPTLTIGVPLVTKPDEPITWQFPAIQEMIMQNGQLHFLQISENEEPLTLDWEAIHVTISEPSLEGPSEIRLSAMVPNPQPSSTLTLNGTITQLKEDDPSSTQEKLTGFPSFEIQGQLDVSQFHLGRLVQFLRGHALEKPIPTRANLHGNVSYTFQKDHDRLNYRSFEVSLDEWSFSGHGSIANVLHESPWLNISGSTQPIAIERLLALVPQDWVPAQFRSFLKDHQVAGTMELQKGSLDGPLDGNGSWEAKGAVALQGGQYLPAPGQPLITNIGATVTFAPSIIQISQARGTIAPLTMTAPEAKLILEGETVQLSIPTFQISEKDWNLNGTAAFIDNQQKPPALTVSGSALPISIQRLANILPEPWRPVSVHIMLTERDIDGEMELLTGTVNWIGDEANTVTSEGVIRVANGQVLVDPNHPPVTHLSGGVVFESNLVRLLNVEGKIAESTVSVKEATLEWKESDIWADIQSKGLLSAHDVYQALLRDTRSQPLLQSWPPYHNVQGNIHISTRIQGPLTNPSQLHILEGDLLLDGIRLDTSPGSLPVSQLSGQMTFDNQQIHIHRFNGRLGNSPIDIKGQWSFRKDSKASNLTMGSVWSSRDLQTLFPSVGQTFSTFEGSIGTTLTLSGSRLRPDYHAAFDFTNIAISTKGLLQKPSGVQAVVEAKGTIRENQAIKIGKSTLSIPPYSLEAQAELSWSERPYVRGFFQTESGTGAMFPEGVIIGDGRLNLSTLGITWGLEGKNWDWTTWSMKGKIEGSNRSAESTTSKRNEDVQSASFQWAQKNQKGKGEFTLKGIPIESLLAPRSADPPPLTGTTFLKTALHMNLESPETMQRSLTGKGNVHLQKGLIQTGPVLSKILGILNVPSLLMGKVNLLEEGLPFDELMGSFSIDQGLLTIKDLAVKSPVLKLSAAGSYDLPTENLDAMVAVSPFGAYSNLLKDIPLFGSLIKGERKGLMTALFEVKGLRTKPEVTYLPLESFAGGLKGLVQFPLDVLKNLVTLPIPEKKTPEIMAPSK
ncbi:MAG: DUF3971 domain-containing protein, partial [Nitrospirota bacterium]|nr:DUF3971 domain-containing protein [Nitrospirota bacterium]